MAPLRDRGNSLLYEEITHKEYWQEGINDDRGSKRKGEMYDSIELQVADDAIVAN
jgi:hypothetical protein